ncbi:hypothetical protein [Vibrio parahaemolyticus]|uniref:hypothetical protein n=1 Tax=Vibrio parahaemolyticus TaxID=670 RepID=UPI00214C9854|nr:hypothetical protein [Vibrio parahaemolyticus]
MIEHLKQILAVTEEGRHAVVVMDGAGWHTEEIANDFKCQCNQTFALFSRAKPYRTSMALVEATNILLITTTSSPKSAMHRIGFWIAPKESPKYAREDG